MERTPLPSFNFSLLLKLFPFGVVFGEDLKIIGAGEKLNLFWSNNDVLGHCITKRLKLRRPRVPFTWKNVSENLEITILNLIDWEA